MAERVDRTERLLNLVICLLASSIPVSRAEIRAQIPGYSGPANDVAFERMFERDKDELRSMGIPVETVTDVNGEVQGYRIPREAYVLTPIDFTVEERAAIAVAAQAWSGAPIAPVPGMALRKLESASPQDWTPALTSGPVELTAAEAALLPLMRALRQRRVVRFDYRTPDRDVPSERLVSPWGLTSASAAWFLIGYDHDRQAERTFRLSRITSAVQVTADDRRAPSAGFDPGAARLAARQDSSVEVRFRVAPGRAAALRRRAVGGSGADPFTDAEIVVPVGSVDEAVSLACSAGSDAIVLAPEDVVVATRAALAALVALHE